MKRMSVVLVSLLLAAGVAQMVSRVGERARFVTWSIVAFALLAAAVAAAGLWLGWAQPRRFIAGALAGVVVSYFLPIAPIAVVAVVLASLATVAVRAGGVAAGVAATTGALMLLSVVAQRPAVECGESSVSAGSGPWWIRAPNSSSNSSTSDAEGGSSGTTQVGEHRYVFTCDGDLLTRFERDR